MVAVTVDGVHEGERRSTYSAANFASVGPDGESRYFIPR